jgi:hypothetical protein
MDVDDVDIGVVSPRSTGHTSLAVEEAPPDEDYADVWRAGDPRGRSPTHTRRLLDDMRKRHRAYSAMHADATRTNQIAHRTLTIVIMVVACLTTLVVYAVDADGTLDPSWTTFISSAVLLLVGTLTGINEFLAFQTLEEQHRAAKNSHLSAANYISLAIASELDSAPDVAYDYGVVLDKVQELHDALQNTTVEVPLRILNRYPDAEPPWDR